MNLKTKYMGLDLKNPVVASAGPIGASVSGLRRLEDAGVAAVVLPSLFEEQVEHEKQELDYFLHYGTERFAESLTYYPEPQEYHFAGDRYLEHIGKARASVDIPVIASLNGVSVSGWMDFARKMEDAGASGLELNVYFLPTNPEVAAEQVQNVYLEALKAVKGNVSIPVAMKLSPYFSAPAWMAAQLDEAGADALVLFNRFYQPDIDLGSLEVRPRLVLSVPEESRLPMRWIAILYGRISASLAGSSGVHSGRDVAKMILAGADVTMMTSALLQHGVGHVRSVLSELREVMDDKGYESLDEMRGILSHKSCPEPAAFERANYMKTLHSYRATGTFE